MFIVVNIHGPSWQVRRVQRKATCPYHLQAVKCAENCNCLFLCRHFFSSLFHGHAHAWCPSPSMFMFVSIFMSESVLMSLSIFRFIYYTLLFVTGEVDIARFDSRRYKIFLKNIAPLNHKRYHRCYNKFLLYSTATLLGKYCVN